MDLEAILGLILAFFSGGFVVQVLKKSSAARSSKGQFHLEGRKAIIAAQDMAFKAGRHGTDLDEDRLLEELAIARAVQPFVGRKVRKGFESAIREILEDAGVPEDPAMAQRAFELLPMWPTVLSVVAGPYTVTSRSVVDGNFGRAPGGSVIKKSK